MSKRTLYLLSFILLTVCLSSTINASGASKVSMQDENISIIIQINDQNIIDAQTESTAIKIKSEEEVKIFLEWNNTASSDLKISHIELTFTIFDFDVYPLTSEINKIIPAYSTATHTIYHDLGPVLKQAGIDLVTGVYKVTCKLMYQILTSSPTTDELTMPLYLKMGGSMLTSALGVATVAGIILSAVTALGAAREVTTTIQTARIINSAVDANKLLELGSIPNGLNILPSGQPEWVKVGDLPKETIKRMYESAKKHWDVKKCPKCKAQWPKKAEKCEKCGITLEEAEKLYSETIVKLTEKAKMPIYKTAGGIGVKVLARMMSIDTMMVNAVLKTMLDSGLAKSKVSRRFVINKFIVNGSKLVVSAIIFLQISGLKVFGIHYFILSIVLGATISFVVGTLVNRMLKY